MNQETVSTKIPLLQLREAVDANRPELYRDIIAALTNDEITSILQCKFSWNAAVRELAFQEAYSGRRFIKRGKQATGRGRAAPSSNASQHKAWDNWTVGSIVNFGFCEVQIVEIHDYPRLHFWGETTANGAPMTFTPYHGNESGWITPHAA